MPSQATVLGPFVGGLNTTSDASAIGDNELSEALNVNVDLDGSLVCRTPLSEIPVTGYVYSGSVTIIGSVTLNNVPYLIGNTNSGVYAFKLTSNGTVLQSILIKAGLRSDCAIQLHNVVFILGRPDSPTNGGTWDGATFTPDLIAPSGSSALFFKGRVWVTPGVLFDQEFPSATQLQFSNPVPLTLPITIPWDPINVIPVGQGDGQKLIDLLVVADNLMLFKNNSTYAFMYDVSPNEGLLRKVNNNIGTSGQFCVLTHGNEAYTYHEGKVYQIANYNFASTSDKVLFSTNATAIDSVFLSLVGDSLILRYFGSLYALNLMTKTWSEWQSGHETLNSVGRLVKLETNVLSSNLEGYYGGTLSLFNPAVIRIKEKHTAEDFEHISGPGPIVDGQETWLKYTIPIECRMTTRIFDFATPHLFKRLMWWGADVISDGEVIGIANPVSQTGLVDWDTLSNYTWDQLFTWDAPLSESTYVITTVDDAFVIRRKFIKLLKSLRFRRVSFSLRFKSDGKTSSEQTLGPSRVFSISAIVGAKQTVVKQVS